MKVITDSILNDIKAYISKAHNEKLLKILISQKVGYSTTTFSFNSDLEPTRESIKVSIYDFEDELIIKLWGEEIHQQQLTKCVKFVFDEVLPRWFPSLYLSATFLPISYPGWYIR